MCLIPALRAARMKASGDIDGREDRGWLFPRGPVAPHATFSSAKFVACTPVKIALQMPAYSRGLTNLPPEVCLSQIGLFGSFHASHIFTAGSGSSSLSLIAM